MAMTHESPGAEYPPPTPALRPGPPDRGVQSNCIVQSRHEEASAVIGSLLGVHEEFIGSLSGVYQTSTRADDCASANGHVSTIKIR